MISKNSGKFSIVLGGENLLEGGGKWNADIYKWKNSGKFWT